jgi:Holliday junction DNA helicase RuvA
VIAQVSGRLAAKQSDRVVVHTTGGVGYEIVVPLGVMERLPAVGETVSLATELVVREDGWWLYGFDDDAGRRFFQRLIGVTGVGPKIAIALLSALGVERGVRAVRERNIALLASVSGIGKRTAERLALELADKLGRLGYATVEADRALRQALAADGTGRGDTETLVRRALQLLTHG